MQLTIAFFCNGVTLGSQQDKLIGTTDELLSDLGEDQVRKQVRSGFLPFAAQLYCSSLRRCLQTAEIAYPDLDPIILKELRAQDYGVFENRSRLEVEQDERFIQWANSQGAPAYPGGESPHAFASRCIRGFRYICGEMSSEGVDSAAIVTHRSVITAILQRFCAPRSYYQDFHIRHGEGCHTVYDTGSATIKIKRYF